MNPQLQQLIAWVRGMGFRVTSTIRTARTSGLGHREGRAVDVGMGDVPRAAGDELIQRARALGYTVLDERQRPPGAAYRYWDGPNLHIEIPATGLNNASEVNSEPAGGLLGGGSEPPVSVDRTPNPAFTRYAILAAAVILIVVAVSRLRGNA